jgi:BMFP domain-containing protein YqiC
MAGKGRARSGIVGPSSGFEEITRHWTFALPAVNPVAEGAETAHMYRKACFCGSRNRPMTQTSNRILDEIARLATDAAGAAQGVRREVESVMKSQIERLIRDMDVATREEVEVLREMVVAAREENARLNARLASLEQRFEPPQNPAPDSI